MRSHKDIINPSEFLKNRQIFGQKNMVKFDDLIQSWSGKGIVILSGGLLYLTNAYMNLCYLRRNLLCNLPVEIWYMGPNEKNERMFGVLESLGGITFIDANEFQKSFPMTPSHIGCITKGIAPAATEGWRTKAYCLLHSRFREVILLDSDCFLFQTPESLFSDYTAYSSAGAVFSSDIDTDPDTVRHVDPETRLVTRLGTYSNKKWDYSAPNPMWKIMGMDEDDLPEFDSGFMIVDKHKNAEAVFLSFYLNDLCDFTYRYLYGDKDTFHLAWAFCGSDCHVIMDVSRKNDHIISHARGSILFEHRVFINKFNVKKSWDTFPNNNCFHMRDEFREYFLEAQRSLIRIF